MYDLKIAITSFLAIAINPLFCYNTPLILPDLAIPGCNQDNDLAIYIKNPG
jgi:hypothetical protein